MARDLILGKTKRNWARGTSSPRMLTDQARSQASSLPATDEVTLRLTPREMAELSDLAATKLLADSGDRAAKTKLARVIRGLAKVRTRAARGDTAAKRTLLVLRESGVFRGVRSVTLGSPGTSCPGDWCRTRVAGYDLPGSLVSNTNYRVAVFRRALRNAKASGRRAPTTRDFYRAKSAVDGLMDKGGLTLYLPRARPGRVTA